MQHCLLVMLKNFKNSVDKGNESSALLTDLLNTFDYIDHKLLTAKLFWYGVSPSSLNLILFIFQIELNVLKLKQVQCSNGSPVLRLTSHISQT